MSQEFLKDEELCREFCDLMITKCKIDDNEVDYIRMTNMLFICLKAISISCFDVIDNRNEGIDFHLCVLDLIKDLQESHNKKFSEFTHRFMKQEPK